MYDLIYLGSYDDYQKAKKVIEKEHPQAKIEDGSDQIHTHRFSVSFKIGQDDWFTFLIQNGMALLSLNFQLEMRSDPDKIKEMIEKLKLPTSEEMVKKNVD